MGKKFYPIDYIYIMETKYFADNIDEAIKKAEDEANKNFKKKSGSLYVPIFKNPSVLINHNGEVPYEEIEGWEMSLVFVGGKWSVIETREMR